MENTETFVSRWFYFSSNWREYSDAVSADIESAFQRSLDIFETSDYKYLFNLIERFEVNKETKYKRKIFRGTWFWNEEQFTYIPYPEAVAQKLESAFQNRKESENIDILRYVVFDFRDNKHKQYRKGNESNSTPRYVIRGYDPKFSYKKETESVDINIKINQTNEKFKSLQAPEMLQFIPDPLPSRLPLNVPGSRCFLLKNILNKDECKYFIQETEKLGYTDLRSEFPTEYRDNERILVLSPSIADCLWLRIEPLLHLEDILRVRPMGFGNEGTWKPVGINECIKFGKYFPGNHFSAHMDGPWIPRIDEASIFTVVFYLNDDFEGGETDLLKGDDVVGHGNEEVICKVRPETGTALIFNHDTLHRGALVKNGIKYVARTEILFERVDTNVHPDPLRFLKNENYNKMVSHYNESWKFERQGDVKGFTEAYLEALRLQKNAQRSIVNTASLQNQILPMDVFIIIFSKLSPKDISSIMCLSHDFYDIAIDSRLWRNMYFKFWPNDVEELDIYKGKIISDKCTKDWFGLFKVRYLLDHDNSPKYIVYVNHNNVGWVSITKMENKIHYFPATYKKTDYFGHSRQRLSYYSFGSQGKDIIENGNFSDISVLQEMLSYIVKVHYNERLIIVAEPPMKYRINIRTTHTICFVPVPILVLAGLDLDTGIVVHYCNNTTDCNWTSIVWKGELVNYKYAIHLEDLAFWTINLLLELEPYQRPMLLNRIACISDGCVNYDLRTTFKDALKSIITKNTNYNPNVIKIVSKFKHQSDAVFVGARAYSKSGKLCPNILYRNFKFRTNIKNKK